MTAEEMLAGGLEVRPGSTEDDPYEVRRYDPASGEWSTWVEQGEFIKRTRGEPGHRETGRRIRELIRAHQERRAEAAPSPNVVPEPAEDQEMRIKRLRKFLKDHPGMTLERLEAMPSQGPLFVLARKMLEKGTLIRGRGNALEFPNDGPQFEPAVTPPDSTETDTPINVRMFDDLMNFSGPGGRVYTLKKGDVRDDLPPAVAKVLVRKGMAQEVSAFDQAPEDAPVAAPGPSTGTVTEPVPEKAPPVPSTITERLRDSRIRFIKVKARDKRPDEGTEWQKKGRPYGDRTLADHLRRGGNYGVMTGEASGHLTVIDGDSPEVCAAVLASLPPTFTVKTGREGGEGRHFYYWCEDLDKPIRLECEGVANGKSGDVKFTGGQVIGPGSVHPSGGRYEVFQDLPVAEITAEQLRVALQDFLPSPEVDTAEDIKRQHALDGGDLDQLRVEKVIPLAGLTRHGIRYQGPCPWHGSETGNNFSIDTDKNVWHCFRHNSGGGPMAAIAIQEGLMDCGDSVRGALIGQKFKDALRAAEEKHGLVRTSRPEKGGLKDDNPMWRFTVNPEKKIPLDQLWRWPECFAKISLKCFVPQETCELELAAALERSGADVAQVKKALEVVRKGYGKWALGEDTLDKKTRDNIAGCGLKVGEDFSHERPRVETKNEIAKPKKGQQLPDGELWVEEGELGFSTVRDGEIITRTLAEWRDAEPDLADLIEAEYELANGVYYMIGRPDIDQEDKTLIKDIIKVLDRFADVPPGEGKLSGRDSPYRTYTAAHVTCTAFYDMVSVRPGLMPHAETKTGKTRLTNIIALSSYRGFSIGAPTEAVLLRALGTYHVTLCIDETADIDPKILALVLTIYKLAFDGQNIARCDLNDQRRIIVYPCKGFVTLSLKTLDNVPDDSINRGVAIHMGHKTRKLEDEEPNLPKFQHLFLPLRTRVAALRLRAQAGKIDVSAALDRALQLAKQKYSFGGEEYQLESRDLTKAQTLLLPIVLMGEDEQQVKDLMEVMLRSKLEGDGAQGQGFPAKCWSALYEEVTKLYSRSKKWKLDEDGVPGLITERDITTKMIADTVRSYLKNEGEITDDKDPKGATRRVTNALGSLNFEFKQGTHRAYFLVTDKPSFQRGWRNCLMKYGVPPEMGEQGG
jgi:hypothetical protein